jgi:L-alanine-DL-glutamate epimerase-like enolase superfamily enzyme
MECWWILVNNFSLWGVKISTRVLELHPRNVFRISRVPNPGRTLNVFLKIERDGIAGHGEASAKQFYGEDPTEIPGRLMGLRDFLEGKRVESVDDIAAIWEEAWPLLAPSRAAQCALDVALWDWLGKRCGVTVTELATGRKPQPVVSFATIGLSTPEELEKKIAELAGFPRVKIKADASGSLAAIAQVRAAMPDALLAVDANCAWSQVDIGVIAVDLMSMGIEFVEQPLRPARDEEMPNFWLPTVLPAMADESCVTEQDVERMPHRFWGFNIKLVKCGGITPALRMARRGRELGLRTMVGCMLESSVLIAAGAVVAQLTDYADLDGAWLLADDPAAGWRFEHGTLRPGEEAGLGVRLDGVF